MYIYFCIYLSKTEIFVSCVSVENGFNVDLKLAARIAPIVGQQIRQRGAKPAGSVCNNYRIYLIKDAR